MQNILRKIKKSSKKRKKIKVEKPENLWYQLLRIAWMPVPKIYFCRGDWTLYCVPMEF